MAQAQPLVVRAILNTEDKGDVFVTRTTQGDFLVRVEDLKAMGFKDPSGALSVLDGEPHISLKSMPGVSFSFDQQKLALNIVAEPRLLPSQSLQADPGRWARGKSMKGTSAFFNYALDHAATEGTRSTTTFSGEIGLTRGDYLFLTDAITTQDAEGQHRLIRLNSSLTRDDIDNLRRTVIGDFPTPSRDLGNGVVMGGVSVSKLFALNPYVVQFPTQTVSGTVALPSDLEVYVDGQRIRTEKLKPGEFELRDILAYGGARSVQVLLRDAFGRVQQLDYSFYFSDQPLKQGLSEYSYNVGALRRRYGSASNEYGPPALSMFHRYGVTNGVTLGLRADAKRGFYNAGPLATLVLGRAGIINLGVAASSFQARHGAAGSIAYNYLSKNWSMGVALRRDSRDYATLGDPPAFSLRRYEGTAIVSYNLPGSGAVSLSQSARSLRGGGATGPGVPVSLFSIPDKQRVTTASYTAPLIPGRASLTASVSRIRDNQPRTELTVRLIVFIDKDHSMAGSYQGSKAGHTENAQLVKNQPIGEGVGYILNANRTSDQTTQQWDGRSTVQYNAPAAIIRGEYGQRRQGNDPAQNDYRVSLAGGVAYAGGDTAFGRPVTGSFGIVKVGELADVAVSVNGQSVGRTNTSGKLFVPTLNPYYNNEIVIAPETVPIEYSLPFAKQQIVPTARGGALIEFPARRVQAVTGNLRYAQDGSNQPLEFQQITLTGQGESHTIRTGRGGEFYIENLTPGPYELTAKVDGQPCRLALAVTTTSEVVLELGDLTCRTIP